MSIIETAGSVLAVVGPLLAIIGYLVKRTLNKVEADLLKSYDLIVQLDTRIVSVEKMLVQIRTYHTINHMGQQIDFHE